MLGCMDLTSTCRCPAHTARSIGRTLTSAFSLGHSLLSQVRTEGVQIQFDLAEQAGAASQSAEPRQCYLCKVVSVHVMFDVPAWALSRDSECVVRVEYRGCFAVKLPADEEDLQSWLVCFDDKHW